MPALPCGCQQSTRRFQRSLLVSLSAWLTISSANALAQDLDRAPINYSSATPADQISKLQQRLDRGELELEYSKQHGYLPAVLQALEVPIESQGLVFSKTSFQLRHISPETPRAVYFNDDVYIGWVQDGDMIEISAVDPQLGTNFYTLSQRESSSPKFQRMTHECLQCHGSTLTRGVPGHLVRSVYPRDSGHPELRAGTHLTEVSSPLEERWGGWYVTGHHGKQRHLGNATVQDEDNPRNVDMEAGANATDLQKWFDATPYLSPHSDIVALMVLEHQTNLHNAITRANHNTRRALSDEQSMNKILERGADYRSESTTRRIRNACETVVEQLLFVDELELTDAIAGTSGFAEHFQSLGPRDLRGRSLREFDLKRRMFKYPCSYLIYSEAFIGLPTEAKSYIYGRLLEILNGEEEGDDFSHLSKADRRAILEILRDTKDDLPARWHATAN